MKKLYIACSRFALFLMLQIFCLFVFSTNIFGQPIVQSVMPLSGSIGTTVTITGENFDPLPANNLVYFGDVRATVIAATAKMLMVSVPKSASYKPISVTVNNLTTFSSLPFTVTFAGPHTITTTDFASKVTYTAGRYVFSMATSDLDGDGKPDMVSGNYSDGTVSVFQNNCTPGTVSFNRMFDLQADTRVAQVIVTDVDGDGKPDIVITDDTPHKLSIFRNTSTPGNFAFEARVDFSTGTFPVNVASSDLDGDGKTDFVIVNNQEQNVSVFQNRSRPGVISFANRTEFGVGAAPYGIAIQDMNADGKADLVVGNQYGASVSVLLNTSTGGIPSFAAKQDFAAGNQPYGIAVTDEDNDGRPDIVTANLQSNDISVLKNTSSGGALSFANHKDIPVALSCNHIAVGDLDGDGKADLSITNSSLYLKVLKNISTADSISFDAADSFYVSGSSEAPAIADADGDGKPDLLVGDFTEVSVLRSTSVPFITSFEPKQGKIGTLVSIHGYNFGSAYSVTFGNFGPLSYTKPNDSTIVARIGYGGSGNVSVYAPDGYDTLPGFTYIAPPVITAVAPQTGALGNTVRLTGYNFHPVADSNIVYFGAAQAKVLSATDSSLEVTVPPNITYYLVNVTSHGLTGYAPVQFSVTFPGGGKPFATNNFQLKAEVPTGNYPIAITVSDLDKDGKPEIISSNFVDNSLSVIKNLSTPDTLLFASRKDYALSATPWASATGDFNGDGKPDVAVVTDDTNNGFLVVYQNRSNADSISLLPVKTYPTGYASNPRQVAIADFNNDGRPDIAVMTYSFVLLLQNTTVDDSISFTPLPNLYTSNLCTDISVSDFNGDGKPDIAVTDGGLDNVYVFRNTSGYGFIDFAPKQTLEAGFGVSSVATGDLDGDGKPDMAVVNPGNDNVSVYRNLSTADSISFAARTTFQYPFMGSGTQPINVVITDMDGDGKPDLTTGVRGSNQSAILRNVCTPGIIAFEDPVNYETRYASTVRYALPADVNGDGRPDILVDNDQNSFVSILTNGIQGALPIRLLTFTGRIAGSTVQLQWKASGATQTDLFIVERLGDGNRFSAIGAVGKKENGSDYTFTDVQPLQGANFYRLKMTDANGAVTYSSIVQENFVLMALRVYPNPATNYIFVSGLNETRSTTLTIYNLAGSIVYQTKVQGTSGKHIPISALPQGNYYLKADSGGDAVILTFMK